MAKAQELPEQVVFESTPAAIKHALATRQEYITVIQTEPFWHYRLSLTGKPK